MFGGWKVNGQIQQEPPSEFWDKFDKALQKHYGLTINDKEGKSEDEQRKAG